MFPSNSLQLVFSENCFRGMCDTGLTTRGFPTALPLTQQSFELVGLNLALPQPYSGGVVILICAKCKIIQRNQFIFT